VKDWINLYVDFTKEHLTIGVPFQSFLRNLAMQHALFEAIHPSTMETAEREGFSSTTSWFNQDCLL